ncbi:MAG: carboxypeptidase-like regulatory domain-containing protein, partial [Thermoanaerobaculia bacterium]
MKRRAQTAAIAAALAAVLVLTLSSPAAAYRRGEYVTISGRVTDLDGTPLAGVTVLLEPSRRVFKLSKMFKPKRNREQTDRLQI